MSVFRYLMHFSLAIVYFICPICATGTNEPAKPSAISQKLAELETSLRRRIGISAVNTANGSRIQYRADEHFPLCSTAKVMTVSTVLKQSMKNKALLSEKISYKTSDLVDYSPVTKQNLHNGMTVVELCAAAITQSDNTAMNLLLEKVGGTDAVTAFARSIGDKQFRLDRREPDLNSALPGDLQDTSTPAAMEKTLENLTLENTLASYQRKLLQNWLKGNKTGNLRIRAGVPKNWIVGDKTGTGEFGTTNDVGVIWPAKCSPIVLAIYYTQNNKSAAPRDAIIETATRLVLDEFAKNDDCIRKPY